MTVSPGQQGGTELAVTVLPGAAAAAWSWALEQAGWAHRTADRPTSAIAVATGSVATDLLRWVHEGGILVIDGHGGGGPVPPVNRHAIVTGFRSPVDGEHVELPGPVALHRGTGAGSIEVHEDRVVKHGLRQGRYPAVLAQRHGQGVLVYSGLQLAAALAAHGDRLRPVADWSPVTERMSSCDKAGIAETMDAMVRLGARLGRLPVVHRAAWPDGARSVLLLRVDVDGVFGDRARRIGEAAAGLGVRASFFLNRELCERHPGDLGGWLDAHDLGQHADLHDLYDEPAEDLRNVRAGADWVRETTGREPVGFVAPRGMWSPSLDAALERAGHRWSSDFGLVTDARPYWPGGEVLQLPVHAYSPERAARWAQETGAPPPDAGSIAGHYLEHLERQVRRGRQVHLYGHPEVLGTVAEQVIPAVVTRARELGLPSMTLDELARHWSARRHQQVRAILTGPRDRPIVTIETTGHPVLELHLPVPSLLRIHGVQLRSPAGSQLLRGDPPRLEPAPA